MSTQSLLLSEVFVSISGESTLAGTPATFVRLSGCNLNCHWCDTRHKLQNRYRIEIDNLLDLVQRQFPQLVIITGGEPLLQASEVIRLCQRLAQTDRQVMLETNGSLDISSLPPSVRIVMDLKPPSSGETKSIDWDNLSRLKPDDEIKIVVADQNDLDWVEDLVSSARLRSDLTLLLSPGHGLMPAASLADWILHKAIGARVQLQLHRLIWPDGSDGLPVLLPTCQSPSTS